MAFDAFLKIQGVDGESVDDKHKGWIEIDSFSWGVTNMVTMASSGGGGAGKASFQDFSIVKRFDKASPKLFLTCATGEHISDADISIRKASGAGAKGKAVDSFLKFKMFDILVSSFQESGQASGAGVPMESISLNFAKIEMEYRPQNTNGSLGSPEKAGYDLVQSKKA